MSSKKIPAGLRRLVWDRYIGTTIGTFTCVCGTDITPFTFEVAHVVPRIKKGSDTIENLRPLCGVCNKSCGITNLDDFFRMMGKDLGSYYSIDTIIEIYRDNVDKHPIEHQPTEYQKLQSRAKEVGIKANYDADTLKELIKNMDKGKEIDPTHLTIVAKNSSAFTKKKAAIGGGSFVLGGILGFIIAHYLPF